MDFDEIEDCFPNGALCHEETGKTLVSAQWLHDFARAIAEAQRKRTLAAIYNRRVTPANDRDRIFNAGLDAAWGAAHGA